MTKQEMISRIEQTINSIQAEQLRNEGRVAAYTDIIAFLAKTLPNDQQVQVEQPEEAKKVEKKTKE